MFGGVPEVITLRSPPFGNMEDHEVLVLTTVNSGNVFEFELNVDNLE